ncbi:MAG: hypothetical protein DHS20C09_19120 [marine bacterium B5-7]|nr:MAG: hypothetical protein DHS20C09_19120 [marine bacterium B5-7]
MTSDETKLVIQTDVKDKLGLLIFIVAYNAEKTMEDVLDRIPKILAENYYVEILIIDDCSSDNTFDCVGSIIKSGYWAKVKLLRNPVNQGYGGNQKIGYHYAVQENFDVVALLHGDGQYAPECLPKLLTPFEMPNSPAAVFGSRMINRSDAIKGGMPVYKYVGNLILTWFQNKLLKSSLSEFHSGYRIYSVPALKHIPFELNTNDFHFDTEIIVQLLFLEGKITEIPIPTYYGNEICHVNGVRYAYNVMRASIKARLVSMGIFFDPKFDLGAEAVSNYVSKFGFVSTHSAAFNSIDSDSVVLDLGCSDGHLSELLATEKGCEVFSVDMSRYREIRGCHYQSCNLDQQLPIVPWERLDYVILLDIIEHLKDPEMFLNKLRDKLSPNRDVKIVVSSGNVCFFVTRMMMFLGQFNYGKRGILDRTHTRLFNRVTLVRLMRYAAFDILEEKTIPAPYPLAIGLNKWSEFMLRINTFLARLMPGLFAYQIFITCKPKPGLDWLLKQAKDHTEFVSNK